MQDIKTFSVIRIFSKTIFLVMITFGLMFGSVGCHKTTSTEELSSIPSPDIVPIDKIVWSPNSGTELLVTASEVGFGGRSRVYIYDLNSEVLQDIIETDYGDIFGVGWAPDGSQIAIIISPETHGYENGGLWIWEKETNRLTEVVCCQWISSATFLDSETIVASFVSHGQSQIGSVNLGSGDISDIGDPIAGVVYDLSMLQEEDSMLFSIWNDDKSTVYEYDVEQKVLSKMTNHVDGIYSPAWSPLLQRVVYIADSNGDNLLYLFDLETNCEKEIPQSFSFLISPTWSPDGSRIAFVGSKDIFILDLEAIFGEEFFTQDFICE